MQLLLTQSFHWSYQMYELALIARKLLKEINNNFKKSKTSLLVHRGGSRGSCQGNTARLKGTSAGSLLVYRCAGASDGPLGPHWDMGPRHEAGQQTAPDRGAHGDLRGADSTGEHSSGKRRPSFNLHAFMQWSMGAFQRLPAAPSGRLGWRRTIHAQTPLFPGWIDSHKPVRVNRGPIPNPRCSRLLFK